MKLIFFCYKSFSFVVVFWLILNFNFFKNCNKQAQLIFFLEKIINKRFDLQKFSDISSINIFSDRLQIFKNLTLKMSCSTTNFRLWPYFPTLLHPPYLSSTPYPHKWPPISQSNLIWLGGLPWKWFTYRDVSWNDIRWIKNLSYSYFRCHWFVDCCLYGQVWWLQIFL